MNIGLSRVFRRGQDPDVEGVNSRTIVGPDGLLSGVGARGFDAKALFEAQYETIRQGLNAHQEQGVLIMAFDEQGNALAQGWLRASLDKTRAAIVGRHTACGVAVPGADRNISLRHLAVLVRAQSHSECRIRVIDLHTSRGFTDEDGQVLSAAMAEGPLFLGLDGLRLVFLMTGEEAPETAEGAYAAIPSRVLIEERKGTIGVPRARLQPALSGPITGAVGPFRRGTSAGQSPSGASAGQSPSGTSAGQSPLGTSVGQSPSGTSAVEDAEQTLVRSTDGPVAAVADLCGADELAEGTLVIRGPQRTVRRDVGPQALARGILVGRYERCAVGLDAGRLSRVHFLIVRDGDDLVGIDNREYERELARRT